MPESPIWRPKKSNGTLKRPSLTELFRPALRNTTLVTTLLVACRYALASWVILQTPRMVPGLPDLRDLAPRLVEQTVSRVQLFQEVGTIAGRPLFAFLVIRIATQRRLRRIFLVPGLSSPCVFADLFYNLASNIRLNGVSVALRKRLKPPAAITSLSRFSPACAPKASPTSCDSEAGVQRRVDAP